MKVETTIAITRAMTVVTMTTMVVMVMAADIITTTVTFSFVMNIMKRCMAFGTECNAVSSHLWYLWCQCCQRQLALTALMASLLLRLTSCPGFYCYWW